MIQHILINTDEAIDPKIEERIINLLKPEFNLICYNPIRASILHLLIKTKELNHALRVEEIAFKLGKRHSVILHHLEQLKEWNLVRIVKNSKWGNKQKRVIWGLNLKYPRLILNVYAHLLKTFYTIQELERMCNVNLNVRKLNNNKISVSV